MVTTAWTTNHGTTAYKRLICNKNKQKYFLKSKSFLIRMFLTRFLNCTYVLISVSGLRNRLEMPFSSESWLTKVSYKSEQTGKNHKNCSKLLQPNSVRLFKCFAIRMKKSIPISCPLPGGSFWRFR